MTKLVSGGRATLGIGTMEEAEAELERIARLGELAGSIVN